MGGTPRFCFEIIAVREIPLSKGYVTQVDDEDFEELSKHKWHALVLKTQVYAVRCGPLIDGKRKNVYMHRQLLNTPDGLVTDHIDRNGLNNQKDNLRPVPQSKNCANREKSNGHSRFKGVCKPKNTSRWVATIMERRIGHYRTEELAALAYDKAAWEAWHDSAVLNFPDRINEELPPDASIKKKDHRGANHVSAGITEDQAREIIARLEQGEHVPSIAQDMGVTTSTIYCIRRGETWRHLQTNPKPYSRKK